MELVKRMQDGFRKGIFSIFLLLLAWHVGAVSNASITQPVRAIINKWQNIDKDYVRVQTNTDEAYYVLSADKRRLKNFLLHHQNSMNKKLVLPVQEVIEFLRLLQLQLIIKSVTQYASVFKGSLEAFLNNEPARPPKTLPREWFFIRKNRVGILLNHFQRILEKDPNLRPPFSLLRRGLKSTYAAGIQAYTMLNEQVVSMHKEGL